jgi:DNA-binding beta-propeller fold protein YncE
MRTGAATALGPAILALAISATAPPCSANVGYERDAAQPSIELSGAKVPHGIAIDQASHQIYVAIVTSNPETGESGMIEQFESDGNAGPDSPFTIPGSFRFYSGVAVDQSTHDVYAAQIRISTPYGDFGEAKLHRFSSSGSLTASFNLVDTMTTGPQIAIDAEGHIIYPNDAANAVQIFDSTGKLLESLDCGACPGGPFSEPASVAVDSKSNLYAVDLANGQVVKFAASEDGFTYSSTLQTGQGAAAVAVDPATDEVFVGDLPRYLYYHIVAYKPDGAQFDDFGAGLLASPSSKDGIRAVGQLAVDSASGRLYVTDIRGEVLIFERTVIDPPLATTEAASQISQTEATLKATVNANGHAVLECHFEYVDSAAYEVTGYTAAAQKPCSKLPWGSSNTPVQAVISELAPGTTYHYRVIATSNAGTTVASDSTFGTTPLPPPPTLAPTETPPPTGPPSAPQEPPPPPPSAPKCRKGYVKRVIGGKARCVKRRGHRRKCRRATAQRVRRCGKGPGRFVSYGFQRSETETIRLISLRM